MREGDSSRLALSNFVDDLRGATTTAGTFTAADRRLGDVNGDGRITPGDALITFNIFLGVHSPTDIERRAADKNQDGRVTPGDALLIFNEFLGL